MKCIFEELVEILIVLLIIAAIFVPLVAGGIIWLNANVGGLHAAGDQGSTIGPRQR